MAQPRVLWRLLTVLSGVTDEAERARLTASALPSLVRCTLAAVALVDEEDSRWQLVVQLGDNLLEDPQTEAVLAELTPTLEATLHGSTQVVLAAETEETPPYPPALEALGVPQITVIPLVTLRSQVGALIIGAAEGEVLSGTDEVVLSCLAEQLAIGIENLRLFRRLERRSERLQRDNELILESAGDGIYGLDRNGKTTFVNPAAARTLGWAVEELLGQPMHDLLHHTKADGTPYPRHECPIYAAFMDGEVHSVQDEVFWRKDGSSIPVEYTSTPIREGGRLIGAVVVFRSLSELRRSQEELKRALSEVETLKNRLQEENVYLREEIKVEQGFEEIVGQSAAIKRVLEAVQTVAPTPANVVVMGETGTGKELIARAVHNLGFRKDRPLIKVNCASIPRDLFESEFFGHVRGAFTGALKTRVGRFELAHKGTLFLDEVGEIPLEMQSKLLRVLQEGQFERVGDERTRTVDVRVIAATNRDLKREVDEGRFRQDLYYRLNVFPIELPPLRDREGDIALLAEHFLQLTAKEMNRPQPQLTPEDLRLLASYDWPGNVRELRNVIERAVITARGDLFRLDASFGGQGEARHLPQVTGAGVGANDEVIPENELRELERRNILNALRRAEWKISGPGGASELLGIKPSTLSSRIKKMGLQRYE